MLEKIKKSKRVQYYSVFRVIFVIEEVLIERRLLKNSRKRILKIVNILKPEKYKKRLSVIKQVLSFLFAILLLTSLMITGCTLLDKGSHIFSGLFSSREEEDAAVETVDVFFGLVSEGQLEEAYHYISSKDRAGSSLVEFMAEFENVTEIVDVEINWVEVKNNIALVGIDITDSYDGELKLYKDIEISLVKEADGSWKIVFWD